MVILEGGAPVDHLVQVREIPVQVHAVRIAPSNQVVIIPLKIEINGCTGTGTFSY